MDSLGCCLARPSHAKEVIVFKFLELSSIMIKIWNKYNYFNDKKFINIASKKNKNSLLKYYNNYREIITSVI